MQEKPPFSSYLDFFPTYGSAGTPPVEDEVRVLF